VIVHGLARSERRQLDVATRYADVLVPETPADVPAGGVLGSVVATGTGDLAGATDLQALRTRVLRMLSNVEDAYAHLRGWGARPDKGVLARPSDLARVQIQTTQRLLADPDIRDATVTITAAPLGVRRAFLFDVEVVDRLGQRARFSSEEA
jgi:hypothetical protein